MPSDLYKMSADSHFPFTTPPPPPPRTSQEFFSSFASIPTANSFSSARHDQNSLCGKRTKSIYFESSLKVSSNLSSGISKPKYGKKPDPSAPKITRPCSECGKKFWSWKALFGHMRCHPERQWRGINPPPNQLPHAPVGSSPEKPLKSTDDQGRLMTEEDHQVAACLLMLANGSTGPPNDPVESAHNAATTNQGFQSPDDVLSSDVVRMGFNCADGAGPLGSNCQFECSSCKKVFGSHQALGGHRASHKNVKGCFAMAKTGDSSEVVLHHGCCLSDNKKDHQMPVENKYDSDNVMLVLGHKCSICPRVFSSGQALGGHMRCHWEKGDEAISAQDLGSLGLDLNLPASIEDDLSSSCCTDLTLDLRLQI